MPSFADSIVLFVLALLLFGPKKLPVLARELGKWMGEFRRASNEFKMQMEDELRVSEQAERQKRIAAMEAAAPVAPPLEEPEHPHLPRSAAQDTSTAAASTDADSAPSVDLATTPLFASNGNGADSTTPSEGVRPIPIATSGDLHMMPPAPGLPVGRSRNGNPLGGLLDSIPETASSDLAAVPSPTSENAAHGD